MWTDGRDGTDGRPRDGRDGAITHTHIYIYICIPYFLSLSLHIYVYIYIYSFSSHYRILKTLLNARCERHWKSPTRPSNHRHHAEGPFEAPITCLWWIYLYLHLYLYTRRGTVIRNRVENTTLNIWTLGFLMFSLHFFGFPGHSKKHPGTVPYSHAVYVHYVYIDAYIYIIGQSG